MRLTMIPADSDGSGRPFLSAAQEDSLDRRREQCAERLRHNRAFVANAVEFGGDQLQATIAAAYLAGDLTRASSAIAERIEADIAEVFERNDHDYDTIETEWRSFERALARAVLPAPEPRYAELIDAGNFLASNPLGRTPGALRRWGRAVAAALGMQDAA